MLALDNRSTLPSRLETLWLLMAQMAVACGRTNRATSQSCSVQSQSIYQQRLSRCNIDPLSLLLSSGKVQVWDKATTKDGLRGMSRKYIFERAYMLRPGHYDERDVIKQKLLVITV